jgi:succinate-semialdehyde dehydrogenase/glutarate-semialdehyde dehydrogenase
MLRARAGDLAALMAREMGKPLAQGRAEADKCAWACEYYAEHAAALLAPEPAATGARESFVTYEPLGPIFAIMPWNFPLWQVFRFAAPNLVAGNTALLKHAESVPGCARAITALLEDAGLPSGVFTNLFITHEQAESVIAHPAVRGVTLTGSTRAGRAVARAAGAHLKKTVLELGGSDAYLVLEDADLDLAAAACATSRLLNAGQSCIAAKRFVVAESVRGAFTERLVARMAETKMGDPMDATTTLGPLARADLREALRRQVEASLAQGARLRLGGRVPDGPGAFYPATVLDDVRPGMPAFDEELFGPVAAVVGASGEAEAIRLANASPYGLGAAVFSSDLERARRIAAHELDAGACAINDFVRSDPRLPFGGVKDSGFGRELGRQGLLEFMNVKAVVAG